jgi:broad specificity phosphatase PhoE
MNTKLWRRWLLLSVLVLCAGRAIGQDAPRNTKYPQQILLIRHAEKTGDKDDVHLSEPGKERAKVLAKLFTKTDKGPAPFPIPDFIIAAHDSKDSQRPRQTVTPLAMYLKLPLDDTYYSSAKAGKKGAAELRDELFKNPKYAGKTVLISWRHSKLPDLARVLKADNAPETWGDNVYDRVWQINYDDTGKATFVDRPQRLMPKDAEK